MMAAEIKPNLVPAPDEQTSAQSDEAMTIAKPSAFSLDKFKSKHAAALANVETLLTALPHHSISQAKDFVRLHPDETAYWSPELCFVNVPIRDRSATPCT
jgi:cytochrome c556